MNNNNDLLSSRAVLVSLTMKHPSGIKVDKSLREGLEYKVGADEKTLHVSKHIFGENINKVFRLITNRARANHYWKLTVPWADNTADEESAKTSGWRLCPSTVVDDLQERMELMENEFYEEAENFLENYDEFIEVAKRKLGSAFKIEDYPDVNDLRKKFVFNFKIKTIPQVTNADDIRLNVSAKMKQRIQSEAEDTIKHNIKNVFKVTVEALLEQVNHIVDKLKKGEQFHARSFDKLRQTVDMLPSINEDILNNDKDIANAHQGLLTVLTSINSFDSLRDDTELGEASRKRVVDDLEKSVDDLKGSFFNKAFGGNDDSR